MRNQSIVKICTVFPKAFTKNEKFKIRLHYYYLLSDSIFSCLTRNLLKTSHLQLIFLINLITNKE
jgi:hypothetical protein